MINKNIKHDHHTFFKMQIFYFPGRDILFRAKMFSEKVESEKKTGRKSLIDQAFDQIEYTFRLYSKTIVCQEKFHQEL